MFFNVKAPIWLISLLETSSIYICLPGVKVGKVTVQPLIYYIRKLASKLSVAAMQLVTISESICKNFVRVFIILIP